MDSKNGAKFFLVLGDSIPTRCKEVHFIDLGESFPTIFFFQFPSMSLFLNLLFEQIANSNANLLAKFGIDTA